MTFTVTIHWCSTCYSREIWWQWFRFNRNTGMREKQTIVKWTSSHSAGAARDPHVDEPYLSKRRLLWTSRGVIIQSESVELAFVQVSHTVLIESLGGRRIRLQDILITCIVVLTGTQNQNSCFHGINSQKPHYRLTVKIGSYYAKLENAQEIYNVQMEENPWHPWWQVWFMVLHL